MLQRAVWLLLLGLFSTLLAAPAARAESASTVIGFSQGGLPLVVHHVGSGARRVLLIGGQHGRPEANTIILTDRLRQYFLDHLEELPPDVGLDVLPEANPDGEAAGTRLYLSGVDPNRNWGSADWQPDAWDSNGVFRPGLGGPAPFSEQETRALRDWLLASRPSLVINYHSAGGFLFGPRDGPAAALTVAYAQASGYPVPAAGGPSVLGYRVTGHTSAWLREQGIPGLFIELSTPSSPEFERNLAGVRAVLSELARLDAVRQEP